MVSYSNYTDQQLTALLKVEDQYAFSEIYNRYMPLLLRHAVDMLHDEDQAQDVVQDIFQMLWEKAGALEIHTSISAFLYASTRFRVLKEIRHSKVANHYADLVKTELEKGVMSTDEAIDEKELARKIENGLSKIPAKMRIVFELSRMQELSHKEIARKLNLSDHTVKRQISNALKIIRESLNKGISLFI